MMEGSIPIIPTDPTAAEIAKAMNRPAILFPYVPAYRSGAFAVLITLLRESERPGYPGFCWIESVKRLAQPLCDASMTELNEHMRTAWSGAATLEQKGLMARDRRSRAGGAVGLARDEVRITDDGKRLARHLLAAHPEAAAALADPPGEGEKIFPGRMRRPVFFNDSASPAFTSNSPRPFTQTPCQPRAFAFDGRRARPSQPSSRRRRRRWWRRRRRRWSARPRRGRGAAAAHVHVRAPLPAAPGDAEGGPPPAVCPRVRKGAGLAWGLR